MKILFRGAGLYLVLVAVAVTVQFFAFPFYAYDAADKLIEDGSAMTVWLVLDWFMAVGLVIVVITALAGKKFIDIESRLNEKHKSGSAEAGCCNTADSAGCCDSGDSCGDPKKWIEANVMFYGSVILTIAFVPNWFEVVWGASPNWTIWHIIDSVLPVIFVVQALRIWRAVSQKEGMDS
ncbi:MAG: hypothetical protein OXI96_10730 [Acidimicrobiaceae bacterium]|nr:hypothetical protein [Acidimicrobiaceae bacterium]